MEKKEQDRVKQVEKKARNGKRSESVTKPSGARQTNIGNARPSQRPSKWTKRKDEISLASETHQTPKEKQEGGKGKGKSEGPAPYRAKKKWSDRRAAFSQVPHWLVTSAGLNAMNADKLTHQTHGQHLTAY